jgi:hypothetical protein
MLNSISKLRPAGNNHYYKYSHCKNEEDLKKINPRFSDDYDADGTWDYSLQDFEATGRKSDTSSWVDDGVGIFQNNTKIKKICIDAPNSISFRSFFSRCPNLEEVYFKNVDNDKIKYIAFMFAWSPKLKTISGNFNPNPNNLKDSWAIFRGCAGLIANNNHVFPYFEWLDKAGPGALAAREDFSQTIWLEENKGGLGNKDKWKLDERYTFENIGCLDIQDPSWSNGSAMTMPKLPDNLSLKNVINLTIVGCLEDEFRTADTMEKCQKLDLHANSNLRHLYKNDDSFSLPSIKTINMGSNSGNPCALSGDSVIKLCNALPKWTDGKDKNNFYVTIHNDNFYNPEVNLAIKKLDKSYITPLEKAGKSLPEEVTEDKGWTVGYFNCINAWGPISLLDEYLQEPILDEIDYSVSLPNGYQRCKWLKSIKGEKNYIDCGIPADNETGLMLISKTASGDYLNGSFGNGFSGVGTLFCPYAGQERAWNGRYNNAGLMTDQPWYGGRTSLGKLNWLNDRQWSCTVGIECTREGTLPNLDGTSTKNIRLFGVEFNDNTYYIGHVYRAKISQGTEIIRDFIPCLNPDGKPCMYDVINGVEYHNQGTGDDFTYELA